MSTFTWIPDVGASCKRAPRLRSAAFGDGYEQRAQDGLNADLQTWTLNFSNRSATEGAAINTFLSTQGGSTAFDWTPPIGASAKFVCKEWESRCGEAGSISISATFRQVPA